jgi:hypothetical protein
MSVNQRHGQAKRNELRTPLYRAWNRIINGKASVCKRWRSFSLFARDIERALGERPSNHKLVRRDPRRCWCLSNVYYKGSENPGISQLPSGTWRAILNHRHIGTYETVEQAVHAREKAKSTT